MGSEMCIRDRLISIIIRYEVREIVVIEHGNKAVFFFRQKFGIKNENLSVLKTGIARDHLREESETELGKYYI